MNNRDFRLRDHTAELLTERRAAIGGGLMRVLVQNKSIDDIAMEYGASDQGVRDLLAWRERRMRGEPAVKAVVGLTNTVEFLPQSVTRPIIELEDSRGIVARLQSPRVPFHTPIPLEDVAPTAFRLQTHGDHKPISAGSFSTRTLSRKPVAAMIVITRELERFGVMGDAFRSRQLSRAVRKKTDESFMESLVASTTATAGQGDLALDVLELLRAYQGPVESAVLIMSSKNAVAAHLGGNSAFKDLGATGGVAAGVATLASDSVADVVALVDASRILIGDEGEMDIRLGRHASIVMNDSASPAGTQTVNLFQSNSVAVLAERHLDWAFGTDSVEYIENADYSATGSPA